MKTNVYEIIIGVKDKDSNRHLAINDVKKDLEEAFKQDSVNFSLTLQKGGYVSENGSYVLEESIRIVLIGEHSDEELTYLINKLKKLYNQESLLYIRKEIDQEYVRN